MALADQETTSFVRNLMTDFAERTGLIGERPSTRYLWTDAVAVCNFLELAQRTGDKTFRELALRLVDQVHHILGRHRADDPRDGWISGLDDKEGERHPTKGGLRIGKALNERRPDEPFDERLEWDRDGQYFHYLTKWVHALARVGPDPLGIGGLLTAAHTLAQLTLAGVSGYGGLINTLLDASLPGLEYQSRDRDAMSMPADYRLAFRELGLSIGLRAVKRTRELAAQYPGALDSVSSLGPRLEGLMHYAPMIDTIEGFWLEPANRSSRTWKEHEGINSVMLAMSLAPEGYLGI